jgi:hypothetical protein
MEGRWRSLGTACGNFPTKFIDGHSVVDCSFAFASFITVEVFGGERILTFFQVKTLCSLSLYQSIPVCSGLSNDVGQGNQKALCGGR